MGPIYSLADFLDMLWRRLGIMIAIVVLGCIVSVLWARSLPQTYQSAEVIQIEQPQISNDLARSTVEGSAARRLQLIEQQLMARASLQSIIKKFDLFSDLPALTASEKIDLLRRSVTLSGVAAVREGYADDGAISVLTITASMGNAQDAQAVAHEVADLTRSLASQQRESQTRETLEFFLKQEENLSDAILELEAKLADFRSENDLSIQGSLEFRRDEIATLNESILSLDREIIAAQLARERIDPNARQSTVAREQADIDAQIESLSTQRQLLQDRRETLLASIQTTPEVQRQLARYERQMTQLQNQLDIVATRRNEAQVGFTLESGDRGERMITLEEAQLPPYPVSASRKKSALLGGIASVLLALGVAFVLELRRPVLRTARQMERETGLVPVVSIPDLRSKRARRGLAGLESSGKKRRVKRPAPSLPRSHQS